MSDGDDEAPKPRPDPNSIMDLDFADFDSSWPFDPFPASPLLFSAASSDQPFSSLWALADFSDEKSASAAALRNPEAAAENQKDNVNGDNKPKFPTPVLELTSLELPDVFIIKERMTQALRYFKESTEQHQILAQVWAPIKSGNRYVLTTSGQPFVLSPHSIGLHQYRTVSQMYSFSVDEETDGSVGLPARVFRQKLPEWTPDVQFYSSKEYSRVQHAKHYNVHGTLALPVFEPSGQSCIGVLELIMTSQKINYAPEVDKVCKALEAVNLRSSNILDEPNIQICNEGRQNALAEILEVFTEVCETYKLPLAQTWVPCRHRSVLAHGGGVKKSCSSFDGSCMGQVCMSTTDVALYIVDAHMWRFHDACAEHHLQKAQGVAGRAFSSHSSCFCEDIRRFSKIGYPLVHYAKMFGLVSSYAICLRSRYTGDDEYVLEFFLPSSLTDNSEQNKLLDSMLATMKEHFRSLMVASGKTLEEERNCMEIVDVSTDESPDSVPEHVLASYPPPKQFPVLETPCTEVTENKEMVNTTGGVGTSNGASPSIAKETKKPSERKRGKAEKQISLEVLQQYFSGSLKDAAKSLGVCPTTMKRICRQHGISRWPSRKINKVNRSLSKLKNVIEAAQGADGGFSLTSISQSTVPIAVGSISWPAGFNGTSELLDERIIFPATKTPGINGQEETESKDIKTQGSAYEEQAHKQNGFLTGSREASNGSSTSHGSCHGSPGAESMPPKNNNFISQADNTISLMYQPNGELNSSAAFFLNPLDAFCGMLVADAGSSKDLRNLDANMEEGTQEPGSRNTIMPNHYNPNPTTSHNIDPMMPRFDTRQEMSTVIIKATFREDMIRFRFSLRSNIVDLREEVARRLKLEVGTFEIKYLDDDHEWVLISCDSDLQECLDVTRSSGSNIIRLCIHDILGNLGSSCESTGE
ncbi:hypothetical protein V2J09_022513 [Rumex salicifolius]